jgi:polyisoprenoid-binding protein YceI
MNLIILPNLKNRTARFSVKAAAIAISIGIFLPALAQVFLKADQPKSAVSAVFKQMNVPVEARFKKFSAQIEYNASKPAAAKAMIDIDIYSFDLGDPDYNKEVLKKEWFNAAQFPKATFISSAIKPISAGIFSVSGKLYVKGKSMDVSFPLTIKSENGRQIFDGALPIKRLMFNIGEGEWKDTDIVADEVTIKFHIVTS